MANTKELGGLIGDSAPMRALKRTLERVARSDRHVQICGPTGSGKELVARALHELGRAPGAPLLDLNCGAVPESLLESLLFGHEKGAFTGADRSCDGYLSAAGEGTLFLDEIGELPLSMQAKLLRVLETARFRRLGSTKELTVRARVISATHADLLRRSEDGRFRTDLYHRLSVLVVMVPSLDERRADIPMLVEHFAALQERPLRFTPSALRLLAEMSWPGNVRQLRNVVDRAAVFVEREFVDVSDLRDLIASEVELSPGSDALGDLVRTVLAMPFKNKLRAMDQALVREAMKQAGGNKSAAARVLGVHRKVVERRRVD